MAPTRYRRRERSIEAFARKRLDELERERARILAAYPELRRATTPDASGNTGRSARGAVRGGRGGRSADRRDPCE